MIAMHKHKLGVQNFPTFSLVLSSYHNIYALLLVLAYQADSVQVTW
jgi:hypothetical protein